MKNSLSLDDYQAVAEFRHQIRRYLKFSDSAVRNSDLEPRQYQLLLALKGLPPHVRSRIGELAEQLQIQHHSAVELVDRLEAGGLVRRQRGTQDRREVLVVLTSAGEKVLRELVLHHRSELSTRGPALIEALRRVLQESKKLRIPKKGNK
jgi:DNA-binding MarR family transcriptional regulator